MPPTNRRIRRSSSPLSEPATIDDDPAEQTEMQRACLTTLIRLQQSFWPMLVRRLKGGFDIDDAGTTWEFCEKMVISQQRELAELAEMDNATMQEFGVPVGWCEDLRRIILDCVHSTEVEV